MAGSDKRVEIQVLAAKSEDPDWAHVARITVYEGETQVRRADLPGGDFEPAKGIAEGLEKLVKAGTDVTRILPDDPDGG